MIAPPEPPPAESPTAEPEKSHGRSIQDLTATISASRLGAWQRCRLQFFFRYVQGIRKRTTPALFIGTVTHTVLQQWNLARWRGQPVNPEALREVFQQAWGVSQDEEQIAWGDEEETEKASVWNLVEMYLRETPIPVEEKPEGVEVAVEADLTCHGLPKLIGVLDLVRAGGRIVDFKTTGKTPDPLRSAHSHETQTTIYGLLYRAATGHPESGIELHSLVKLKTPKLVVIPVEPVTEQQRTRLLRIVESYLIGLAREDFIPSPGLACLSCEFFNECRSWH